MSKYLENLRTRKFQERYAHGIDFSQPQHPKITDLRQVKEFLIHDYDQERIADHSARIYPLLMDVIHDGSSDIEKCRAIELCDFTDKQRMVYGQQEAPQEIEYCIRQSEAVKLLEDIKSIKVARAPRGGKSFKLQPRK